MSYYIHAAKFFLKNVTEIGGYLEVTDDGKFGEYLPETAKPDGDIVEHGTHEELMQAQGVYYKMQTAQQQIS